MENTTFLVVDDKAAVSDIWYTFDFVYSVAHREIGGKLRPR